MRAILLVSLCVLLCPALALAQTASTPTAAPPPAASARGGDISRDEYIQRAVDRAKRAAEKRFDQMDANHDGMLTAEERRSYRAERRAARSQSQ